MSTPRAFLRLCFTLAALLGSGSCHWRPRQLVLRVGTDLAVQSCGGPLTALRLLVSYDANSCEPAFFTQRVELSRSTLPVEILVRELPGTALAPTPGDPNRTLHLCLEALSQPATAATPTRLFVREVLTRFPSSPAAVPVLNLTLAAACASVTCAGDTSCGNDGLCAPRQVDSNALPNWDPDARAPLPLATGCDDAGPPSDAAEASVGMDAALDAFSDVPSDACGADAASCTGCPGVCGVGRCVDGLCLPRARTVALSAFASCVSASDGRSVLCAGDNARGELGHDVPEAGVATGALVAGPAMALPPAGLADASVRFVAGFGGLLSPSSSANSLAFCAAVSQADRDRVWCWGQALTGNTDPLLPYEVNVATGIPAQNRVLSLSVGGRHACVILSNGLLQCWGTNLLGATGSCAGAGASVSPSLPTTLTPLGDWGAPLEVAAGSGYTCVLNRAGQVFCWGRQLGSTLPDGGGTLCVDPGTTVSNRPLGAETTPVLSLTAGFNHACALLQSGAAVCWGDNSFNALGAGTIGAQLNAVPVQGGHRFAQLAAGRYHTCGLDTGGAVWCWGSNSNQALALTDGGGATSTPLPTIVPMVPPDAEVLDLAAGYQGTCLRTAQGSMTCWGRNDYYQLWVPPEAGVNSLAPTMVRIP